MRKPVRLTLMQPTEWLMKPHGHAGPPMYMFDFKNNLQLAQATIERVEGGGLMIVHPGYFDLEIGPANIKGYASEDVPEPKKAAAK